MKTPYVVALAVLVSIGSVVRAQTATDLLQQGIYKQETLGDLEGAIQIYKQVIAATQQASELRAQAQRRLQAAETQRRLAAASVPPAAGTRPPVPRPLGTFDGRTYRHTWTGITFDVPAGWKVSPTYPSSDQGEMVSLSTADATATLNVWLISEENDAASVEYKLANAAIEKKTMRTGFEGWRIREGSLQRVMIGGHRAVVATADFTEGREKREMAEYLTWIYTEKARAFFFARVPADELDALRPQFDGVVYSAIIP